MESVQNLAEHVLENRYDKNYAAKKFEVRDVHLTGFLNVDAVYQDLLFYRFFEI
jgi:hypothetical protein